MRKNIDLEDLTCEMERCISMIIALALAQGNEENCMTDEHNENALFCIAGYLERISKDMHEYIDLG